MPGSGAKHNVFESDFTGVDSYLRGLLCLGVIVGALLLRSGRGSKQYIRMHAFEWAAFEFVLNALAAR